MNLMPPQPPGRRYFTLGIIVILLWWAHFATFAVWLYLEQIQQAEQLEQIHEEAESKVGNARKQVGNHEDFMKKYASELDYRVAVKGLENKNLPWSEAMDIIDKALLGNGTLTGAQVEGNRFQGEAVFSSGEDAAIFLGKLSKNPQITKVFLDCIGSQCEGRKGADTMEEGEQRVRFHFQFRMPPIEEKERRDRGLE